jgi:GNAT superfamily N-acetyltransferase
MNIEIHAGQPTEQFVLNLEGKASCICTIYHNKKAKVLLVDDVFVKKQYRRQGYGTQLMKSVYDFAKEKNVDCIELVIDIYDPVLTDFYYNVGYGHSDKTQLRIILNKK